jgi:excisionase family DNA binding protein
MSTPTIRPKWWTVPEIASQFGVSNMTIYRLVSSRRIQSVRVGRSIRIPDAAVQAILTDGIPLEEEAVERLVLEEEA